MTLTADEIEETLNGPSLQALLDFWDQARGRDSWQAIEQRAAAEGNADGMAVARRALADHQAVSAVDGLRANERIVSLLTGWRWQAMRQAREEGHSWSEIGSALNMSKQAAWESGCVNPSWPQRDGSIWPRSPSDLNVQKRVGASSEPVSDCGIAQAQAQGSPQQ